MTHYIAGKFGREKAGQIYSFEHLVTKTLVIELISQKVITNLDGFSLANRKLFAKFTKLHPITIRYNPPEQPHSKFKKHNLMFHTLLIKWFRCNP